MKKLLFFLMFLPSLVFSADVVISITIPDAQVTRVKEALFTYYPKESGYTDLQWTKEVMKKIVARQVYMYEQEKARNTIQPSAELTQ